MRRLIGEQCAGFIPIDKCIEHEVNLINKV